MNSFLFMALLILLITLLFIGGIWLGYRVLVNFQPGSTKIQKDIGRMRSELQPYLPELIPLHREEMELLSLNQLHQVVKKGVVTTAQGVFTSVYQEPMIAYAYKKYVSPGPNALLYARTAGREFVFRIRKRGTGITVDGQPLGELRADGTLLSSRGNALLGKIQKEEEGLPLPILVKGRELAILSQADLGETINPRAFQLLDDNISEGEEVLLLSIAIFEMVQQSIRD